MTIIFPSSNREHEDFAQKIQQKLLEVSGNNPIISVSQKPMDLGHNICVGDVGASYPNMYRQLLIGAEEATTDYVAVAEADQLYPPGYFDFEPTPNKNRRRSRNPQPGDLYMNKMLYILRSWDRQHFCRKEYGTLTVIVRRAFFIARLHKRLKGLPQWGPGKVGEVFYKRNWEDFDTGIPVISVKTKNNLGIKTGIMESELPKKELPHWGEAFRLSSWLWQHENVF